MKAHRAKKRSSPRASAASLQKRLRHAARRDKIFYFVRVCGRTFDKAQVQMLRDVMLKAYRWQYIASGVQDERFQKVLGGMITEAQMQRIGAALAPILS